MTVQPFATRSLRQCEAVIERGLGTFVEVGRALAEIRDGRLYRESHGSFEDYCRERWKFSRQRALQMIDAAEVTTVVVSDVPISNEAQARALTPVVRDLGPHAAAEVLEEAAATGRVTASGITQAAQRRADALDPARSSAGIPDRSTPRRNRRPLTEQARGASYDLLKAAERLQRLTTDDRWNRNAPQIREAISTDLRRAIEALTTALEQLQLEGTLP